MPAEPEAGLARTDDENVNGLLAVIMGITRLVVGLRSDSRGLVCRGSRLLRQQRHSPHLLARAPFNAAVEFEQARPDRISVQRDGAGGRRADLVALVLADVAVEVEARNSQASRERDQGVSLDNIFSDLGASLGSRTGGTPYLGCVQRCATSPNVWTRFMTT
ncbi:MAG: hypothetical protein LH645_00925 [Actinomycetia bacterium]|nr:hypothetical protein [Actinomycetes bacterium]